MKLTVEIKIDGRLVGGAIVHPLSSPIDNQDFKVEAVETAAPHLGLDTDFRSLFSVRNFDRFQTVWALVAKIADRAEQDRKSGRFGQPVSAREDAL